MLLKTNNIDFVSAKKIVNWQNVVNIGVSLLQKNNIATSVLSQKILDSIYKYGQYYIIMPNVALLHAAPGSWCKKIGISMLVLENSIKFGFDHQEQKFAKLIFTLSAIDGNSHMDLIKQLSKLLGNEQWVKMLINSKNKKELLSKINSINKEVLWK